MAAKDHDRNLLFGILAVQMDFITRDALVTAMHAWVLAKDKPLGEILVEQKALVPVRRTLLEALVDEHLKQHDNDPEKSLAAVSSLGSVRNDLLKINDPEVQASLVHVSAAHSPAESFATRAPSVGSSTSAGTRFRILRPHAKGGLGQVSVARDEELNREVALKEIQDRHADNPESRSRFMLEAEITGGLEHPSIVPVYGLGQYADGRPYYAMRFIRGDSLKEAVDRYHDPKADKSNAGERAVELRKLLGRFLDVCNAIAYAHSRGVLHRDLKPGNIMLGQYGETLVVDWGLAKALDRQESKSESSEGLLRPASASGSAATQMGSALGTPQYMSPEQAAGRLDLLGPASDVYSLGATLYYVLTGKPPIEAEDIGMILKRVERGEFPPPRASKPEIALPLEAICLKAMALKPGDRYATPKALAEDIERWLADEPVTVHRDSLFARLARVSRRHRVATATIAALLLAAVVGLSIGTVLLGHEKAKTENANQQIAAKNADLDKKNFDLDVANKLAAAKTREAVVALKATNRQLALSYIDRGVYELDRGDRLQGFAILGQAYRATSDVPSLRPSVCSLLAAWDGALPRTVRHDNSVCDVAFSPDGTKIATASVDKTARLWDVATGKPLGNPLKHDSEVLDVALSPDGTKIATVSQDKPARLWDVATSKPLGMPLKHDSVVTAVAFSPDSTKIATVSWDRTARLWDAATGKPLGMPLKHDSMVTAVAFSPDGTKIATASFDNTARLWDTAAGKPLGTLKHDNLVTAMAFSPDGTKIATESNDKTARLWDVATGKPLGTPLKHDDGGRFVAFGPDGTRIATDVNLGKTARLWDIAAGMPLGAPFKHDHWVRAVAISSDGMRIATASEDSTARLWDAATGKPLGTPLKHSKGVCAVAFSPDGTKIATASWDGTARLWDATTGKPLSAPLQHGITVCAVAFSPDGTKIATASSDYTARVWDVATGTPLGSPLKHASIVFAVVFSPDGARIATASEDRTARLWDVATGKPLGMPLKHDGIVFAVAFSPDGTRIATASEDRTAQIWDAARGKPLGSPLKHDGGVRVVVFSPDGTKIATASEDTTARLWDAATGKPLGSPLKHDSRVTAVSFSPDGTKIATASEDTTARLWDVATGKPLGIPFKHAAGLSAVAFSPDGTKIATASLDKTAQLWSVPKAVNADPSWIAAYVKIASQLTEDEDSSLHPLTADEADASWRELLKSPAWLEDRTKQLEASRRTLHVVAADEQETAKNRFAAAFHLRWLAKLEPNNPEWKARLAKAEEHLAEAEEHLAEAAKTKPVDSGKTR